MRLSLKVINWKDSLLPLILLLVVAMIVFPVPSWGLDILLAANISFCILLMLSSVFVAEPERFTSLPSILLISTLYRLGLNVSSTRLILSGRDVPELIVAFGQFVVTGSTIVGLVIFSIISIIQFLVIAKGSERVAEVAARFTLDAMPGKQMSIDADMRAGLLSISDAREKRRELHREAKLYGALDGAMKFIKGDAIVGLCITLVNILAGILIGAIRDGMALSAAIERYTLLTVGDGLISQLPAVLVSVSAGIVITRVSEKEGGVLSSEIVGQVTKEPIILLMTSVVLTILSIVPGLPAIPFLILSGIPMFLWVKDRRDKVKEKKNVQEFPFKPRILPPIVVKLSPVAALKLQEEETISIYVDAIRGDVYDNLGVVMPDIAFDIDPNILELRAELFVYSQSRGAVSIENVSSSEDESDPWGRIVGRLLNKVLRESILDFINDSQTRQLLDMYEPHFTDVINDVVPEKVSVTTLTLVLRQLVQEGVGIRDFGGIMQALAELFHSDEGGRVLKGNTEKLFLECLRVVREKLGPTIVKDVKSEANVIEVFLMPQHLEEQIITQVDAELSIYPQVCEELRNWCREVAEHLEGQKVTLLVPVNIRTQVFRVLKNLINMPKVISPEEVPEYCSVEILNTEIIQKGEYAEAA